MRTFSRTEQARQYVVGLLFGVWDRLPKGLVDVATLSAIIFLAFVQDTSEWLAGFGFGILYATAILFLVASHFYSVSAMEKAEWRTFVGYLPRHDKLYKVKLLMPPEIDTKEKAIANIKGQW